MPHPPNKFQELSYQIQVSCPQCGGPILSTEPEHILTCPYCQVRQIVQPRPYPYLILPPRNTTSELYYVPYFRFKGLIFNVFTRSPTLQQNRSDLKKRPEEPFTRTGHTVPGRIVDQSILAINTPELPFGLGLKAQTQPLIFFDRSHPGNFIAPSASPAKILHRISQQGDKHGAIQAHIGEIFSLIYAPFSPEQGGKVQDAISGQVINLSQDSLASLPVLPENAFHLQFLPSLCPDCGWDLHGQAKGLTFSCANCQTSWYLDRQGLVKITPGIDQDFNPQKGLLLPFWIISFTLKTQSHRGKTLTINRHSQLVDLALLPRLSSSEEKSSPPQAVIPGFKIQPEVFLRLAKQLTLGKTLPLTRPGILPGNRLLPLTLAHTEASEALVPLLACITGGKRQGSAILARARIEITRMHLSYLYFQEENLDLIQPRSRVSFLRSILRWGEFI